MRIITHVDIILWRVEIVIISEATEEHELVCYYHWLENLIWFAIICLLCNYENDFLAFWTKKDGHLPFLVIISPSIPQHPICDVTFCDFTRPSLLRLRTEAALLCSKRNFLQNIPLSHPALMAKTWEKSTRNRNLDYWSDKPFVFFTFSGRRLEKLKFLFLAVFCEHFENYLFGSGLEMIRTCLRFS